MQSFLTTKSKCAWPAADASLAKALAPEDVHVGDHVMLLHVAYEMPSYYWSADAALLPPDEPVRVQYLAPEGGLPLKVRAICLPFVLAESPLGPSQVLDLRRCSLARLDKSFAKIAWKSLRQAGSATSGHTGSKPC